MLDFDGFIPNEMLLAQPHPLDDNLMRHLPDSEVASTEEIREIQLRDRIPGIIKRLIPLNPLVSWEYWWSVPGRILLPEDVEVLQSDRPRLEAILAKLVWLLGGHCFGDNTPVDCDSSPVYNWQQILAFVEACGMKPDLLDIDFLPTAIDPTPIAPRNGNGESPEKSQKYVAIEPAHWHIEFFEILPIEGGFQLAFPKKLCSCQIWTGTPFIKNLETGETVTRYDLWVSSPHDMINPPWLEPLVSS
ncbi:hypothetical protein H6S82_15250 [Planktothrix sp. FACHB-1355]|uniref:Uncharacterized protein n=1 Tax=Aerosakkonema funiforme FACHB-1375 TaxID=2949571 RepID=A0A926VG46_9CYAN|nr:MULTISPECIES: hypothetical protein [Oscillatoriales]MBD2183356.1 hypothetical protein [Aerosakkonema funiforme FACHB-1375]MBD3560199.1 hypothetical protein [Planktothrix sp. FACHB-1355]